jgi:RNA polymerase sigma-70 factor (ECF subfamily)
VRAPAIQALFERLYRQAKADRWRLPSPAFANALEASCAKAFPDGEARFTELARYLESLHLEDLALACACAEGHADAWDHFVLEIRPVLYRAVDALDPTGASRDIADSLYGDLYGVNERGEARPSLLRYFHGRSSLSTWLRAVLAQRYVDRVRASRRSVPLEPYEEGWPHPGDDSSLKDPDCPNLVGLLRRALAEAIARLNARDRLRLKCYYAEQLTLAQTGKLLREHEATVSRQLARARKAIRDDVERGLRARGLSDAQVARCFECATEDVGDMDVAGLMTSRKELARDRST